MPLVHRIVPPRKRSARPPLLVLLHGIGADEEDLVPLAPSMDPRLLIVSVRAPTPEPPGYRWYAIDWTTAPPSADPAEVAASRDLLASFVEETVEEHGADASRVFLMGFSQGAIMSLALLLARPELVRGVVAHSGRLPRLPGGEATAERLSGKEVLILHGEEDPVVPVGDGRRAYQLLAPLMGARVTFIEYPAVSHTIVQESLDDAAAWLQARVEAPPSGG